ncbi:MAG: hypothetical protein AAFX93_04890 [Verrucomicrobiota bacterium]
MSHPTGKICAIVGAWLQLGLLFGVSMVALSMISAFNEIADGDSTEPVELTEQVSVAMSFQMIGGTMSLAGMILLAMALLVYHYRAPWFYNFLKIGSIFLLLAIPVGTVIGVLALTFLNKHREEFRPKSRSPHMAPEQG